jgi:glycosyltransferase involved in cell wall biosynthesis
VIVDDGSTDPATLAVLSRLEEGGARIIRRPNGGLSAAATSGVAATTAPYVFRFDADDVLVPGALGALAEALDGDPEAVVAWGDLETFGETHYRVPSVPALDPWLITFVSVLPASSLFRRSAIEETGGWRLRDGYEDWDLLMTLAEKGYRGVYVPTVVYRYRRAGTGLIADKRAEFDAHFRALQELHARLFAERDENRHRSRAPLPLQVAVRLVNMIPGLGASPRVQFAQLFTHLLWNGGFRAAWPMVRQRLRRREAGR